MELTWLNSADFETLSSWNRRNIRRLIWAARPEGNRRRPHHCWSRLACFKEFGTATRLTQTQAKLFSGVTVSIPTCVNEFWTAKQRAANSLHEISYRACFKPQLPRFFIQRLTTPGEVVHDPFMGRGTTIIEAALLGRIPCGCDVNPLSVCLARPRLEPPAIGDVEARLADRRLAQP